MKKKTNGESRAYEIMLILSPNLTDSELEKELTSIKKLIKEMSGNIFSEDIWGVRELSYIINKSDKGYYAVYYAEFEDCKKIKELERLLTLQNNLFRFLILKISKYHIIKSQDEYEAENLKEEEESKKEKQTSSKEEKAPRKRIVKKVEEEKEEVKKDVSDKPVEEEKTAINEERKEDQKQEEDPMTKLSEVDEKLKSLIDDPDISL